MLKHFYKSFIVSIICGSLSIFQPATLFAAGTNTTDSQGVITNTQTKKLDKVSDNDMLASLAMLSGGFIAGRMISVYKPMTNDVLVAGAAGVAFIAGEILSNMKFKGTIDEMTIEVTKKSDHSVNEEQIKRLQDLKKSYEEAKKTTNTKKTLQLAAAAGFGIAAAMAGYMAYTEYTAMQMCINGIAVATKATVSCPDVAAAAVTAGVSTVAIKSNCAVCASTHLAEISREFTTINLARTSPGNSLVERSKIVPLQAKLTAHLPMACQGYALIPLTQVAVKSALLPCNAALKIQSVNQIAGLPVAVAQNDKPLKNLIYPKVDPYYAQMQSINYEDKNVMTAFMNFIVPKAEASWLPLLGLSAGVAASFAFATTAAANTVDLMMFVPFNRAIAFGAFAGVSFLASQSSANVIEKLDENIKKIDDILNNLARNAAGVKAQNIKQQTVQIKTLNPNKYEEIQFSKNGSVKTSCMQNNSSENCKPVTEELRAMPGFATLPESFRDLASQTTGLADKLSGSTGLSGSTLAAADALGKKQKAISNLLSGREAAYEKLNDKVNFNKEQGKFLNNMKAAIRKGLGQSGTTASGLMSSIGGSPITGTDNLNKVAPTATIVPAGNVVDMSAKGEGKEEDESLKLSFDEAPQAAVDMSGSVSASAAPEYQIDSNEINGENGPSIFEVISGRYIKSGYPKLLEEEPTKK